jgi:hypothetical protein
MKRINFSSAIILVLLSFSLFQSCKKEAVVITEPVATTVTLKTNIITAQTLKDLGAGIDYIVEGNLDVKGVTLTIEPGVVVQFAQNASLRMLDFGAMKAVGTSAKPLLFTGAQKTKGFWKGLIFESTNNTDNQLEFCTIEYAGEASAYSTTIKGALLAGNFFSNPVLLSLKSVTVQHNTNNGLYIDDQATLSALDNCTFTDNTFPIKAMEEGVNSIDNDNNFTGNTNDVVEIAYYGGSTVTTSTRIRALAVPYRFTSDDLQVTKGATITFEAGVRMEMFQNSLISAYNGGVISMEGTANQPITFNGIQKTRGFWRGIISYGAGSSVTMKYVQVNDGGDLASGTNAMVSQYLTGSALQVTNCKMANFSKYGLSYIDKAIHNADIETSNSCDGGGTGCILKR